MLIFLSCSTNKIYCYPIMYFSLIYFSKANKLMKDEDLLPILEVSQTWNKGHGITGMLLYMQGRFLNQIEGRFIQVLEGTEAEVKVVFEKIKNDSRHRSVIVLDESETRKRNFESWLMGFEAMELEDFKSRPDFFELDEGFLNRDIDSKNNKPLNFLNFKIFL